MVVAVVATVAVASTTPALMMMTMRSKTTMTMSAHPNMSADAAKEAVAR